MSTNESKIYRDSGVFCAVERTDEPDGWRSITVILPAEFEVYFANRVTEFSDMQGTLKISFFEQRPIYGIRQPSESSASE